jgi:hypothetical protein
MCILAIQYQATRDAPILIAQNRDERYDRPSQQPRIQSGRPRVVCGIDRKAGGTWLGVNQHSLFVSAINAPKRNAPYDARSRGLLCRELLGCVTAEESIEKAYQELSTGHYAGVHYVIADSKNAAVVYGGDEVEIDPIRPGLHIITENRMDDPYDDRQAFVRRLLTLQTIDSSVAFLAVASQTFSRRPDPTGKRGVVICGKERGTVSSTLLSLSERNQNAIYQYAPGPPSEKPYDDVSALLRQVLSTDRHTQKKKS